ncbi:MAG: hydrogenase expression/formation protein HypE [Planctomycetota bacterium]
MNNDIIMMGHGGGGALTGKLIKDLILKELGNPILAKLDDSACLDIEERELVFTTDSYVIDPIFFPGGNIGDLAVCGTTNDLVMQGAEPRYLSLSLIIQEGLAMADLKKIVASIKKAADETGVQVVTGDTKVVENSSPGGGIFVNTAGIGVRVSGADVSSVNAVSGDVVIVTGTIGDHGIAIMNEREDLGMDSGLKSDTAPLWSLIKPLLEEMPGDIHCLRDPTRGGVAAALCDIAENSKCSIKINEKQLPVKPEVRGACGMLGLEILNVANEGKAVIICPADKGDKVLGLLHSHKLGKDACIIAEAGSEKPGRVTIITTAGGERIVDVPAGEDLPRIC